MSRQAKKYSSSLFSQASAKLNDMGPGGLILIQGYRPKQLEYKTGGPSQVELLYTRELLEKEFAGCASVEIEEDDREVHEGSGHGGMSALIDLIARK